MKFITKAGVRRTQDSSLRSVMVLCLLITLPIFSSTVLAQNGWRTLDFEVFAGNPYTGTTYYEMLGSYDWLESEYLIYRVDDATAADVERALHEAARWYQDHGFPSPALEPVVETDQGEAFRVYVCSYDWEQWLWDNIITPLNPLTGISVGAIDKLEWSRCGRKADGSEIVAAYVSGCNVGSRNKVIYVNEDAAFDANGRLTELGYQTLAHELMHAVMPKTEFGQSAPGCEDLQGWITEGIPDAIGWDIAEDLWQARFTSSRHDGDIGKRWGTRLYSRALPQRTYTEISPDLPFQIGYRTSSFWRFLADAYPGSWKLMVSANPEKSPGLLDLPLEGGPGWRNEVTWLDKALRKNFNYGLNAMYAAFVGWFAYSIAPYTKYQHAGNFESLEDWVVEDWIKTVFGPCYTIDLSAAMQQSVTVPLRRLGSRCLWLEPVGIEGGIQVTFQAEHSDSKLLDDIWISKPGTTLQVRASNVGELPDATQGFIATWKDFPQDGNEWGLYLVSNVAHKPGETLHRDVNLKVSRAFNSNSARNALPPRKHVPTPGKPKHEKHAKTLNRQRSETQKMINEQINEDKKALSEHVSSATLVGRVLNGRNCSEPFVYAACGPQMSINLSVMPGTYIAPGQANAQGGMAAQVMGGLNAMAQTSAFDTQQVVTELDAKLKAMDGSAVSIYTPLFDYGFSGTFDSAQIIVTMKDEKKLSAFGPPDAQGRTRLTGKVTIEEYTPYIVRGSFVAPLAEFVEGGNGEGVYTSRGTVTGTFTSVAPWQHDERVNFVYDSQEVMAQDIVNSLGVPAGMANRILEDGTLGSQGPGGTGSSAGSSSGGGLLEPDCSCECEDREAADELCEFFCEAEFAACE